MADQIKELRKERRQLIEDILSSDLHGKRIYLLGSAEFGPTNEPILIKSTTGLYNKFGKHGSLIDAFHELKYVSKNNYVYLVKTTGEHSTAYLNVNVQGGDIIPNGLVLTASQSNEYFDDIQISIDTLGVTFKFPESFGLNDIVYKYDDYYNIDRLVHAINADTKRGNSFVYAYHGVDPSTPVQSAFYSVNPAIVYLYGGQCGLNYSKNLLYNCLEKTYETLESHEIDIVIPVDAFMDDICPETSDNPGRYGMTYYQQHKDYLTQNTLGRQLSFMDQLINFCVNQLNFGMVTTGIIGYNSNYQHWSHFLHEADDLAKMYKACFEYNIECCSNPFYAFLVSVVAGDIMYNKGTIVDNGYLAYAALCAGTLITRGTTNIPISNSIRIWQEFSEDVLKELSDTGIVVFRHSPLYDTPVVYDGITAKFQDENLKLHCNVRMIQMAISFINHLFKYYVGHDIVALVKENIIGNDLTSILKALKYREIITQYNFEIVPFYGKGEIKVYLTLMTNYMIKPIQVCTVVDVKYIEEA